MPSACVDLLLDWIKSKVLFIVVFPADGNPKGISHGCVTLFVINVHLIRCIKLL